MGTNLIRAAAAWIAARWGARFVPARIAASPSRRSGSLALAACGWIAVVGPVHAVPVTYDFVKEFSITAGNPNGQWTYGWETTGGAAFIPYGVTDSSYWPVWVEVAGRPPAIQKNTSSSANYGVAPGQVSLHPGPSAQPSIARWTAPAGVASPVVIDGQFFAGDSAWMQVGIFLNDNWTTPLFHAVDAGVFHLTPTLSSGDTIDFAVYGGYAYGNTPLDARITVDISSVPEIDAAGMGSVLALVTGALGLFERRRMKIA